MKRQIINFIEKYERFMIMVKLRKNVVSLKWDERLGFFECLIKMIITLK